MLHSTLDFRLHTPCARTRSSIFVQYFKIFGIWPQTDIHTYIHTHARAQCNHASVGLAQARPNNDLTSDNNDLTNFYMLHPCNALSQEVSMYLNISFSSIIHINVQHI